MNEVRPRHSARPDSGSRNPMGKGNSGRSNSGGSNSGKGSSGKGSSGKGNFTTYSKGDSGSSSKYKRRDGSPRDNDRPHSSEGYKGSRPQTGEGRRDESRKESRGFGARPQSSGGYKGTRPQTGEGRRDESRKESRGYGDRPQSSGGYKGSRPPTGEGRRDESRKESRGFGDRPHSSGGYKGSRPQTGEGRRDESRKESRGYGDRPHSSEGYKASRPQTGEGRRDESRKESRGYGDRPQSSGGYKGSRPQTGRGRTEESRKESRGYGDRPQSSGGYKGSRPQTGEGRRDESRKESRGYGDRPQSSGGYKGSRPQTGEGRRDESRKESRGYGDRPQSSGGYKGSRPQTGEGRRDESRTESRGYGDRPQSSGGYKGDRPDRDSRPKNTYTRNEPGRIVEDTSHLAKEAPGAQHDRSNVITLSSAKQEEQLHRVSWVLSHAGLASRREAERYILAGRVTVNDEVLTDLAMQVGSQDKVEFDGSTVVRDQPVEVWLYNKRRGLITSRSDPDGRATIFSDLPEFLTSFVTVGRLDYNSEGLLILINHGGLSRQLELPSSRLSRRYRVRAYGPLDEAKLQALANGVEVDGVRYRPMKVEIDSRQGDNTWLNVEISEGKNREIRRLMEWAGLQVNRLIRVSYGPFQLGSLETGAVLPVIGRRVLDLLGDQLLERASVTRLLVDPRRSASDRRVQQSIDDMEAGNAAPESPSDSREHSLDANGITVWRADRTRHRNDQPALPRGFRREHVVGDGSTSAKQRRTKRS